MYTSELGVKLDDDSYYFVKYADMVLSSLSDNNMKKVLSNVNNSDLTVAMKVLSGKAIEKAVRLAA